MEFRYRAGEEKPLPYYSQRGDGYFTAQPLRASYVTGGDLRRHDSLLQSHVPCPSARDALRREFEKERIREEIIAREILLRRELEEEVRRELAVEREFALRRQAEGFAFASSSSLLPTSWPPLPPVDSRIGERSFIASHRSTEGACFGRLSAELQPDPTVTEIKSVEEIEKVKSMTSLVAGTKIEPTSGNELAWLSNMNSKVPKEWSCALCQVSATSKNALDKHLQGKRHQAKEAQLKGSKKGGQPTIELPTMTEKNVKIPRPAGKDDGLLPERPKNKVQKKRKTVKSNDGTKSKKRQKTEGAENGCVTFVCELCNVKCHSEVVLQDHYRGKKHKARVNCRNGAKAAITEGPHKKGDGDFHRGEDNDIHKKEDEGLHRKEDEGLHRKEDEGLHRKEDDGLHKKEDVESNEGKVIEGGETQIVSDGVLKGEEGHQEEAKVEACKENRSTDEKK